MSDTVLTPYRGLICDLDGVVYRGPVAVPGAVETLEAALAEGVGLAFATNNASRPPEAVAEHLCELGVRRDGWSVVTSSQAAAAHLAAGLPAGTRVLAVGGPGVSEALAEAGLEPVRVADLPSLNGDGPHVSAVVQGLGLDVTWHELATVGHLVRQGLPWVATNLDLTLPTADGLAPGNGALVALVRTATDAEPHAVGKPGPALFDLARTRLGTDHATTLAIGDRVDTDVAGANAAGVDSLLVMSGASRLRDVALAPAAERPTFIAPDLTGLLRAPQRIATAATAAEVDRDGVVRIVAELGEDSLLAAVVRCAWEAADAGRVVSEDESTWLALEARLGLATA